MVLFEDGDILYQYQDVNFGNVSYDYGASATVGIRGGDAANSLQYSFNQAILQDNFAICFDNPNSTAKCGVAGSGGGPLPWLAEAPVTGTLSAGTSVGVDLTWDASVPEIDQPGVYNGMLVIRNNDPASQGAAVPAILTVLPSDNLGKLAGTVSTSGYCGTKPAPLPDATVFLEGSGGYSFTLQTDANGYYQRWLSDGENPYNVTASLDGYSTGTAVVTVTNGLTTTQDFVLTWLEPCAIFVPDSLSVSVELGLTTTLPVTLSNDGAALLDFELKEKPGEVIPLHAPSAGEDVLVVEHDTTAATAMETALTTLGFTYLGVSDIQFQAMPVSELLTYQAVFHAGTTGTTGIPGASEILLLAYLDAGGSLYISDNDLGYWRHGYPFYDTYLQAIYGIDNGGDLLTGDDIMTGLTPDITADPYPDNFTIRPEGVQIFHFTASGIPAGVSVDRNGYRAIYTSFDFQYIASADDRLSWSTGSWSSWVPRT